jgi:hypothetical protein
MITYFRKSKHNSEQNANMLTQAVVIILLENAQAHDRDNYSLFRKQGAGRCNAQKTKLACCDLGTFSSVSRIPQMKWNEIRIRKRKQNTDSV